MPEVGRAFSSCLRNGLRMMGIVTICCCIVVQEVVFVKDVDRLLSSDKVHNATVVRSHERRRWRLSGSRLVGSSQAAISGWQILGNSGVV